MQPFSTAELACPHCGKMDVTQELIDLLNILRSILGPEFHINSAYRCPEHNAEVGGAPDSQHVLGRGADLRCLDAVLKFRIIAAAIRYGAHGIGVGPTFVHVDVRNGPAVAWTYPIAPQAVSSDP